MRFWAQLFCHGLGTSSHGRRAVLIGGCVARLVIEVAGSDDHGPRFGARRTFGGQRGRRPLACIKDK